MVFLASDNRYGEALGKLQVFVALRCIPLKPSSSPDAALDPALARATFERLSKFEDPAVVKIFEIFDLEDQIVVTQEYIEGCRLYFHPCATFSAALSLIVQVTEISAMLLEHQIDPTRCDFFVAHSGAVRVDPMVYPVVPFNADVSDRGTLGFVAGLFAKIRDRADSGRPIARWFERAGLLRPEYPIEIRELISRAQAGQISFAEWRSTLRRMALQRFGRESLKGELVHRTELPDFSPNPQEATAVELTSGRSALALAAIAGIFMLTLYALTSLGPRLIDCQGSISCATLSPHSDSQDEVGRKPIR